MELKRRSEQKLALVIATVLAIIGFACVTWIGLARKGSSEQAEHNFSPVSGVQGFDLKYKNVPPKSFPFFVPGYAVWANYPYFTHDGKTYERAGVGGVVIRTGDIRSTRYQVTETVEAWDVDGPRRSTITIYDKKSRSIVATRILRQGEIEHQMGWVGQHAAEFVRRFLLTDKPIGMGGVGVKIYPSAQVNITAEGPLSLPETSWKCSPSVTSTIIAGEGRSIGKDDWQFLPQSPIDDFACEGENIIVLSGIYPNHLFLDLLTKKGVNVFQTDIHLPVLSHFAIKKISGLTLSKASIKIQISLLKATNIRGGPSGEPDRYFGVTIPIPPSAPQ
ncbi:hypothetical protein [Rhodanobacter sp. BL-MT-08]